MMRYFYFKITLLKPSSAELLYIFYMFYWGEAKIATLSLPLKPLLKVTLRQVTFVKVVKTVTA